MDSPPRHTILSATTGPYEPPSSPCPLGGGSHCAKDHYRVDGKDEIIRCCWCGTEWVLAKRVGPHHSKPHGEWA